MRTDVREGCRHIFAQLKAEDFYWLGGEPRNGALRLKPEARERLDERALVFVVLKGKVAEKKKLMAAFGYVTADGERFEGLCRGGGGGLGGEGSVPLVQMLLGARETNQGLTFLRLQQVHILEPNPRSPASLPSQIHI